MALMSLWPECHLLGHELWAMPLGARPSPGSKSVPDPLMNEANYTAWNSPTANSGVVGQGSGQG